MDNQQPTLILFDIDGTLLTSDSLGRAAFDRALVEMFGIPDALREVSFAGATDLQVLDYVLLPRGYTPAEVRALIDAFGEVLARHLAALTERHAVQPLPGTLALVMALAADPRARLGLVTGNVHQTVPVKLRAAGFDPACFPVGAFGHESADRNRLPPLAVQRARDYWAVDFAPERVVIVGDTPSDVICARSVGGRALAVLTGFSTRAALEQAAPYAILEDLTDLRAVEAVVFGRAGNGR